MLDHPERADGPLQLGHEIVADRLRAPWAGPGARLFAIALERLCGVRDGLVDGLGTRLLVADRVDLAGRRTEERVRADGQILDRALELVELARPGRNPAGSPEDDRQAGGQGDEAHDRQEDQELLHRVRPAAAAQPDRLRSCSTSAEPTSNRSPTTSRSAKSAIGASGSRLTATTVPAVHVVERVTAAGATAPIEEAKIIVAGGRGVGGPDGFGLVEQLAEALGGAVGATRAAVDSGWIPYSQQIGQTGKIVKPELYLALGISGAIQHKVGMQTAGTIVAVNRDPDAPIADFADLLVVGDLFEVGSALVEQLRSRSG